MVGIKWRRSSLATVKPPIFLWEPNELLVWASVEAAESGIEPYDVNVGVVYDAEGRLLAFELDGRGRLWEKRVVLRERESEPTHQKELRTAIVQASLASGIELDPSAPLGELTQGAWTRFRTSR